jgi:hypothetical protein
MWAHHDEVVILRVVEARMKGKNKVVSVQLRKSSLFIENGATRDFSSGSRVLVDSFESIQVRGTLLSHKVNGRSSSRTQGTQELVIIEARGAVGTLGVNGGNSSLKKGRIVRGVAISI